jgi:hypothetical protein
MSEIAIIEKGIVMTYHIKNIDNYEDFLNNLFIGLEHYKKKNPDMMFKISYNGDEITVKKFYRSGSSN